MPTVFTKIINGEIPCYKIAEDDQFIAFLDIAPLTKGHTLVVPKKEVDYIFDLDDSDLEGMIVFAKMVAKRLKMAIECNRVAVLVLGLEVPHTHIHLVPINSEADINLKGAKLKLSHDDFVNIQKSITSK